MSGIDALLRDGMPLSEIFHRIKDYILNGQPRTQAILAGIRAHSSKAA
jgi:hypothetical protein